MHFPFSSLVMQTPILLTKLSDESIIFIIDVGKKYYPILFIIILSIPNTLHKKRKIQTCLIDFFHLKTFL
jgi:hypothetical protein